MRETEGDDLIDEDGEDVERDTEAGERLQPSAQPLGSPVLDHLLLRDTGERLLLPHQCFGEFDDILAVALGPPRPHKTSLALWGLKEAGADSPPGDQDAS